MRGRLFEETPTARPLHFTREPGLPSAVVPTSEWPGPSANPGPGFHFPTVHDYAQAYRSDMITPEEVARQTLEAIVSMGRTCGSIWLWRALSPRETTSRRNGCGRG
ncbi:MAG: hypothetical protein JXA21_19075 [Anaerolineae bacterium]|nr:hypothetical protein [Anaerolineae bacterium]